MLKRYVMAHVAPTGQDGRAWGVKVGDPSVRPFNDRPHVVIVLTMMPPDRDIVTFTLHYDVIMAQLPKHQAFTFVRTHWVRGVFSHDPEAVGVLSGSTKQLQVRAGDG